MRFDELKVKVFADGADIEGMKAEYRRGVVKGFTTNPTLMKKAGVKDYVQFASEAVREIPDLPISLEVFADDFDTMYKEAQIIGALGDNVYIKIPITNAEGVSSIPLIKKLSEEGKHINVTAVFTLEQVKASVAAFAPDTQNVVSVFAGRITNAGVDAEPIMKEAAALCHGKPGTELLWASSRELFNIIQADRDGCDIITVTNDLLAKIGEFGKDLDEYSLETVRMFINDGKALGFSILGDNK